MFLQSQRQGVNNMVSTLSPVIVTHRLILRSYCLGDESWYYKMSQRNHAHLERYEPENPAMVIKTKEDAKKIITDFVNEWKKGSHLFMGVFLKESEQFVAQLYIGLVHKSRSRQDVPSWHKSELIIEVKVNHRQETLHILLLVDSKQRYPLPDSGKSNWIKVKGSMQYLIGPSLFSYELNRR